jgi:hypothetical protein
MTPEEQKQFNRAIQDIKDRAAKPLPWWKKLANWVWIHTLGVKDA